MRVKGIIWAVLILLIAIFALWAWGRIVARDTELHLTQSETDINPSLKSLNGRILAWSTTANVPFDIRFGEGRTSFFELLGVPKSYRPFDIKIGRAPVRNEWNVAAVALSFNNGLPLVRYLTEKQETFLHTNISADGRFVVATRETMNSQNLIRFRLSDSSRGPVAPSSSFDRWPSCTADGSRILFHSYRDGNPGGDLYIAEENSSVSGGWDVLRLTDSPEVEYILPRISADGSSFAAVEREIGTESGRVVLFRIRNNSSIEPVYLTDLSDDARFPSLDSSGELCAFQAKSDDGIRLFLWSPATGQREIEPLPESETDNLDYTQPTISPDGKFISFVLNSPLYHANKIGIYDIERDLYILLEGCDGSVMFPALSNPVAK
ncbi:MAG TPA: hypothetical protein ENN67_04405 [Firmicutes bacterium]|nr:hypothetical protein [Bacillota bacterium]